MNTTRCNTCGAKAVIYMAQHRLPLCKPHYIEWFINQTQRSIKKYRMCTPKEKIVVAVSGGKDSLSLWDVLHQLGYSADGLYIDLGIKSDEDYSNQSKYFAQKFADERGLVLHVFSLEKEYGRSIYQLYRQSQKRKGRPCSVCGVVKRHIMNQVTRDHNYSVIATGHNLDDEAAVLLSNTLSWSLDYLSRQYPVLDEEDGFARKIKPFCRFYERETAAYALLNQIDYVYEECPFSTGSTSLYYKGLLNHLEEDHPGSKIRFFANFLEARNKLFLGMEQIKPDMFACPTCGQPTTAHGNCYYCRITQAPPLDTPSQQAFDGMIIG